jgi:hypothetical protein
VNPLLRPLDVGWSLLRSVLAPPAHAASEWLTGVGRALLPTGDVYDVVEPGPGGSYKIVSAHPKFDEAMIVLDALVPTGREVTVMRDVDVQRHNRAAAMRVFRAQSASTYCGPDIEERTDPPESPLPRREPGASLPGTER